MLDTARRISLLSDDELVAMHKALDESEAGSSSTMMAHHLATTEMLKRSIEHGHVDDEWSKSVVLVDQAFVDSADEIEAPEGFEKAWSDSLSGGGEISIFLTVDGYVLKSSPTVSDVHVSTIKADGYEIPSGVQSAAKQALEWIEDGESGSGFTSVGRNRAKQLAAGGTVSKDILVKMRSYLARHAVDKEAEGWGDKSNPTPGMVAWYAWGGDAGRSWTNDVLGRVEKRAVPEAVTDLMVNTKNRQYAIDEYMYGPMNPDEPGSYWDDLGKVWGVDADIAMTTRCGNCAVFNQTPKMLEQIADAIGEAGEKVVASADIGYCELFEFKCAGARACSAWISGGSMTKHYQGKHDQKSHGGRGSRLNADVVRGIIEDVKANGGLSVSMVDGSNPPGGYMVARTEGVSPHIVDSKSFFGKDGPKDLSSFFKDNKKQLTEGDYLGVWNDESSGKVFLDVAQNVKSRSTAERLGRERDQISIWDVVKMEEVDTGGTGKISKSGDKNSTSTGHDPNDGHGDRRLRSNGLGNDHGEESLVAKHGDPGRDPNYGSKHPGGSRVGNTFQGDNLDAAVASLARGEKITLSSNKDANTFIDKMREYTDSARERGEEAEDLNLCSVSVPGTNLFCGDSLGVERIEMPQLAGKPVAGSKADKMPKDGKGEVNVGDLFREKLEASGVDVRDDEIPAAGLKASQNELKGGNVAFMMSPEGQKVVDLENTRIFVSSDGYVIDGHHRWAANIGLDAGDGKLGDKKMKVTVIDMPIREVLQVANDFADEIGIAPKAAKETFKSIDGATLFSKSVEEDRFTLGPMYIPNMHDAHSEWTDSVELQKAVWDYVRKDDRRIRLQHDRKKVAGEFVEIMSWPYEVEVPILMKDSKEKKMTFPADTVFLGVVWEPWAWEMVKAGKLRGYSIGGRAERLLVDLPDKE